MAENQAAERKELKAYSKPMIAEVGKLQGYLQQSDFDFPVDGGSTMIGTMTFALVMGAT